MFTTIFLSYLDDNLVTPSASFPGFASTSCSQYELPLLICYVLMTRHVSQSFLFFKWTDLLISISIDAGDSAL